MKKINKKQEKKVLIVLIILILFLSIILIVQVKSYFDALSEWRYAGCGDCVPGICNYSEISGVCNNTNLDEALECIRKIKNKTTS